MIEVSTQELAEHLEELLTIKYACEEGRAIVKKLLRKKDRKTIVLIVDSNEPVIMSLSPDGFSVTTGDTEACDASLSIPLVDIINMFVGILPIKSFLTRRARFRGSPLEGYYLNKLFAMDVGDRDTAMAYFQHYFLDD